MNGRVRRCESGFTLIELLVVIAIISLLVSILLPSLSRAKGLAKTIVCRSNLRSVGLAAVLYAGDHDQFIPFWYQNTPDVGQWQEFNWPTWYILLASYVDLEPDDGDSREYLEPANELGPNVYTCPTHDVETTIWGEKWVSYAPEARSAYMAPVVFGTWENGRHQGRFHEVVDPTNKSFLTDRQREPFLVNAGHVIPGDYEYEAFIRHNGAANGLFFDHHIESIPYERAESPYIGAVERGGIFDTYDNI